MSNATKEKWKIMTDKREGTMTIVGEPSDIEEIAQAIKTTHNNKLKSSKIFILKVKGFPLSSLRTLYDPTGHDLLDEAFPVQCKFEEERGAYIVKHTGMAKRYPIGFAFS